MATNNNNIIIGYRQIPLTKGFYTIVDDDDYDMLAAARWNVTANKTQKPYAVTATIKPDGTRSMLAMHRILTCAPPGILVDHRNLNTLDNRKSNLRLCTYAQNSQNRAAFQGKSSRFKGVGYQKKENQWRVTIQQEYIGQYNSELEAARIYDREARKRFGEFAWLNFPDTEIVQHEQFLMHNHPFKLSGPVEKPPAVQGRHLYGAPNSRQRQAMQRRS